MTTVLVTGHNLVNPLNRARLAELARLPDLAITALVPHRWTGSHGEDYDLERDLEQVGPPAGYRLIAHRVLFRGKNRQHRFLYGPGLARAIEQAAPDLVHIEEEPYSPVAFQLARAATALRVPFVVTAFQNISKRFPVPFCWMERWVLARARGALCGSPDALAVLRGKGFAGASFENSLGVDPEVYRPGRDEALRRELAPDGFAIGFVGRLDPVKGLDHLFAALAGLPGARLVIVGQGPEEAHLRALADRLGIAARLTWVPTVPHASVPRYLSALDVVVLPSVTTPSIREQFGRILVEAMSCGVPVVGSSSGGIPATIGDAGVVVPEGDPEALRAALADLALRPARAQELALAGRARVLERFTWGAIARRIAGFYREVLGPR